MYVARIPNRGSPPAILLRESYREGGKVRNRTLANLSRWPEEKIDALSRVLKGLPPQAAPAGTFEIVRSLPHGHVAAVLGTLRALGLQEAIDPLPSRSRELVCARGLRSQTATSSLGQVLSCSACDEDDLYEAMDWLYPRQPGIEDALARRHPKDGVRGRLQIVYGLLATNQGIPIAVEVFKGNTGDPATLSSQVTRLKERFSLSHVCVVGDRGMLTKARLEHDVRPAELDFITALRAPQITALVQAEALQLSLFDDTDLFEIAHPDYPGERLVACKNPFLAQQRARKREELLAATEAELQKIAAAVARQRRPLRGKDKIALRVGRVINRRKVGKHFVVEIGEESFSFRKDEQKIAAEAALDGIYVLRTSLEQEVLEAAGVVSSYKALSNVERVFRGFNTDLDIRPIRHRTAERVRTHVFLRMLSYYVTWHMNNRLAPMLFTDDDPEAAQATRTSPVAPARRSEKTLKKIHAKRTADDQPVHSFTSLLADLATICLNKIQPTEHGLPPFNVITTPTPIQRRAFELLGVSHRLGVT